jgi:hypothetical protein
VVAGEKRYQRIVFDLQYVKQRRGNGHARSPIPRLLDNARALCAEQLPVVPLVRARYHEHRLIAPEQRLDTFPRLIEETLTIEKTAELLRPRVPGDLHGEALQAGPVAAGKQNSPRVLPD